MPDPEAVKRAKKDKEEGKSASTQAGEFIKAEFDHIREGKHGARSPQQAIAIGLSEARRAGVDLPTPEKGKYSEETREQAKRELEVGDEPNHKTNPKRSKATTKALQKEGKNAASHAAISRHSKAAANKRTAAERSESAKQAAETKGPEERSEAAKKAARTRKRNESSS
jgi:hypothetical protein